MTDAMRKDFEARFPRPDGVYWDSQSGVYYGKNEPADEMAGDYYSSFAVWQAALEHAGRGVCPQCNGRGLDRQPVAG